MARHKLRTYDQRSLRTTAIHILCLRHHFAHRYLIKSYNVYAFHQRWRSLRRKVNVIEVMKNLKDTWKNFVTLRLRHLWYIKAKKWRLPMLICRRNGVSLEAESIARSDFQCVWSTLSWSLHALSTATRSAKSVVPLPEHDLLKGDLNLMNSLICRLSTRVVNG